MTRNIEIDAVVAITHCPCCQAEVEVREVYEWEEAKMTWYDVVPAGTPDRAISAEEYRQRREAHNALIS